MQTIEQIRTAEEIARKEWEATKVAAMVGGREVTIAQLRAAFDTHAQNPAGWKESYKFVVPADLAELVSEACSFFLGCPAKTLASPTMPGHVRMSHRGYQG